MGKKQRKKPKAFKSRLSSFYKEKGISAGKAAMQHWVKILFGATFGWIFTAVLTLSLLTSLINPREYDKLIPAMFIIGVSRLSKE